MGEYVVFYCILDDRVHMEMPVEGYVYVTQRFIVDIEEELKQKADNYTGDKIDIFLKMYLTNTTFYRYYPSDEMIKEIRRMKLYNKIVVKETKPGVYDRDNLKIIESEHYMKAVDGDEVIIFGEKE